MKRMVPPTTVPRAFATWEEHCASHAEGAIEGRSSRLRKGNVQGSRADMAKAAHRRS
eukprot:CAMPEP_0179142716 /NCGR_PEP_ID=MMETSP0796-20121207/68570_1 /TAXON_ID=73915 /ORGANISM="Pyrodinium bahamense, Strain pbaha01" /LENGTH=56 /DNA_ID=CAMNT_0020842629 /DNA_START=41 /DNA_END=209 /DNA_ORIENTATION=+